jgi:hypothetical protein
MSIAEREAAGGRIPDYAQENPHLYYFDTESSTYRRIEGEGHSRTSEFPTGYRESTHEAMVAAHTREGQAQGTGRPVDAAGNPIPREDLTWLAPPDSTGHRAEYPAGTDITYDHNTSCVSMWNNGANVTNPDGTTTTYPAGRSSSREMRTNFYNDTSNLVPMPRSENSSKGGGGGTYNSLPTTSTYEH